MKKTLLAWMFVVMTGMSLTPANEKVLFQLDFESPDAAKALARKETVLAEPGFQSSRCVSQSVVAAHNNINLRANAVVESGMELTFDYRTETRAGELRYIGVYLITPEGKKMLNAKTKPSSQWQRARIPLTQFGVDTGSKIKEPIQPGENINLMVFNGRGAEKTTDQTVFIDNVKLVVK